MRGVIVLLIISAWAFHAHLTELIAWIRTLGIASVIFFCLLYCIASLLFLPIVPIILAGGALYGPYWGSLINILAATLSALVAFMIGRYIGIEWLPNRVKLKIEHWMNQMNQYGWKSLALCRLMPFIPCAVVNYAFGFTQIKARSFVLTSFIFFIPYKFLETYSGYLSFT